MKCLKFSRYKRNKTHALIQCRWKDPVSPTSKQEILTHLKGADVEFASFNHTSHLLNITTKFHAHDGTTNHILDILNRFKELSGLTTNVSKTKYALFGNAPDNLQITPTTGFTTENSHFRLLGITLTGDLKHLDINWLNAIKAVRLEIFQWSTIRLTTTAKVNVTKTCLLSKFTHLATALPLPNKDTITEIEKIIIKFINGKRPQYSKIIIFTPKKFGGL